jgi:hypothetical protein
MAADTDIIGARRADSNPLADKLSDVAAGWASRVSWAAMPRNAPDYAFCGFVRNRTVTIVAVPQSGVSLQVATFFVRGVDEPAFARFIA